MDSHFSYSIKTEGSTQGRGENISLEWQKKDDAKMETTEKRKKGQEEME